MNIIELVQKAKKTNPKLKAIPYPKAAALVRSVLNQLKQEIDATEEGVVKVPLLGRFKINLVEKERDGEKIIKKQISFRPVAPKE